MNFSELWQILTEKQIEVIVTGSLRQGYLVHIDAPHGAVDRHLLGEIHDHLPELKLMNWAPAAEREVFALMLGRFDVPGNDEERAAAVVFFRQYRDIIPIELRHRLLELPAQPVQSRQAQNLSPLGRY